MAGLLTIGLMLGAIWSSSAELVTISNVIPRTDSAGQIMDAHDSRVVTINGTYYWFAASYGDCIEPEGDSGCADIAIGACGFQTNHNVTLFTTTDLVNWTNAGVVFGAEGNLPPNSVLFAPKTVYNPVTQMWVMWFNYITGSFSNSFYGVATSATATGPFKVVNSAVQMGHQDVGDEGLFVDNDGTGYVIYTSSITTLHAMSIERLSVDMTQSLGLAASSGYFGAQGVEAPMMFRRQDTYYAVFGHCCCYCGSGLSQGHLV
jgi:hypothetical protein